MTCICGRLWRPFFSGYMYRTMPRNADTLPTNNFLSVDTTQTRRGLLSLRQQPRGQSGCSESDGGLRTSHPTINGTSELYQITLSLPTLRNLREGRQLRQPLQRHHVEEWPLVVKSSQTMHGTPFTLLPPILRDTAYCSLATS